MIKFILKSVVLIAGLSLVSCSDDNSDSTGSIESHQSIDKKFNFSTRVESHFNLKAINELGKPAVNALFSIYQQDPSVGEDGGRDGSILPLYQGRTDEEGQLSVNLEIGTNVTELYVYPEVAGVGFMQKVTLDEALAGLTFRGNQLPTMPLAQRSIAMQSIERDAEPLGENYKFYTYFMNEEVNRETGMLNIGTGLITSEVLQDSYKNKVEALFPEKSFYTGDENNSDIIITDDNGAEVWVTFISDGGFINKNPKVRNGLYYYIYTEENAPSSVYNVKTDEYMLTAVFPNVNLNDGMTTGTRVQLLYYDKSKNKYVNVFPKGTHIGFVLNYMGYNVDGKLDVYGFSLKTIVNNPYCSTKEFNLDVKTHGILVWDEEYKCYTLGMERGGASVGDNDFNDILAKVSFSPVEKQGQVDEVEPPVVQPIVSTRQGTLAFEDNWPNKGDYDFNDFVTSYEYKLIKNATTNLVNGIELSFTPKAIGASVINGFGIQLPVSTSSIISVEGATLENGNDLATIIVYENTREAFNNKTGFINTSSSGVADIALMKTIKLTFATPLAETEVLLKDFNPFIFRDRRSKEIHLVDYAPTAVMDLSIFGRGDDKSNPSDGIYYRMDNYNPWALDLNDSNWSWPKENKNIKLAYPQYSDWYETWKIGKIVDWMDEKDNSYIWTAKEE